MLLFNSNSCISLQQIHNCDLDNLLVVPHTRLLSMGDFEKLLLKALYKLKFIIILKQSAMKCDQAEITGIRDHLPLGY